MGPVAYPREKVNIIFPPPHLACREFIGQENLTANDDEKRRFQAAWEGLIALGALVPAGRMEPAHATYDDDHGVADYTRDVAVPIYRRAWP